MTSMLQKTIHEAFSAIACAVPERVALETPTEQMTYAQLARRSGQIARGLRARGVERGSRVGIYAQRGMDAIAAMLGILEAGAAFVPFDPAYPANLLKFVYEDCMPAEMLVQSSLLEPGSAPFWSGDVLDIHSAFADVEDLASPLPAVDREDPAYIMYTSGSTGHPKGVLVPHRAVVRLVIDNHFAHMGSDEVHLQLAPLAFDASTFEIWGALLHGAKLAILPAPYPSLDDIAAALARHGVTTLWLTAGLFHLMVDHRLEGLKPLRQLLAGGDVLSPPHIAKALQSLPGCRLINGYGPTENTTFTCCYSVPRDAGSGPLPIGLAIAHTDVYILDDARLPVAEGQEGELYAGGDGLALGYWNRPDLTAEKFVTNPFDSTQRSTLYRTGDRVRRRDDGNIEFMGRVDRQVKINGKRVELDEIEACLRRSGLVADAAVTASAPGSGSRKVFAYVTEKTTKSLLINDLRVFLKNELPDYMVPASISILSSLPLSPTGKVDRSKLPAPSAIVSPSAVPGAAPRSEIESQLLGIWRQVLSSDTVGVDDNFFDLGGTSLQLIQAHATIVSIMKCAVSVVDLFQYPRISALAAWLTQKASPATAAASAHVLNIDDRARKQQAALALARARPSGRRVTR